MLLDSRLVPIDGQVIALKVAIQMAPLHLASMSIKFRVAIRFMLEELSVYRCVSSAVRSPFTDLQVVTTLPTITYSSYLFSQAAYLIAGSTVQLEAWMYPLCSLLINRYVYVAAAKNKWV